MGAPVLHVRPERPDHPEVASLLGALDAYLASLYPPEANHILDVQALLAPEVDFLVAEADGRVVACGATRRPGGREWGEIKRMFVRPDHRGQGIGGRLLDVLERRLAAAGAARAVLETGRDQHEALRLYRRAGYRPRAAFGGYPDNGLSVFLEKAIAR
jgi:putative acetyltransferase